MQHGGVHRHYRGCVAPVHVATRFITAINLRTARAMGLTVPPSILLRANVVVDK
jgi:hypothetical protein